MVRDGQAVVLRHEKCNLGPLQEEIRVEFDQEAKVFKRFGTIPGQAAAAALVRNTQRAAILKMIGQAADAGGNLSMNSNAPGSNIYNVLSKDMDYPHGLQRRDFFTILRDLEREQLIGIEMYRKANRTMGQRVVLSEAGKARVAIGSGAPPTWAQREDYDD